VQVFRQYGGPAQHKGLIAGFWLVGLLYLGDASAIGQTANGAANSDLKLSQQELIRQFEAASEADYTIAAGDEIDVQVPTHTELQGHHIIGPDGEITIPIMGSIRVSGLTRETAAKAIETALNRYYDEVPVGVQVTKYGSNRVMVVGRVAAPGPISFETTPTLLEALTKSGAYSPGAGGIATPGASATIGRCAIYRGSEEVLWVDLKQLLSSGTSGVDITLRRGDIVYVPDDQSQQVSVLGQVRKPGAVVLSSNMRLVDVLADAGGLTDDAAGSKIRVVRPSSGLTREVAFQDLVKPQGANDKGEIALQNGDVIYVPQTGFSKFGYVLQKISPMGSLLMFGALMAGH
jgi:polysaccharide biosynthesis/export protein